MKKSIIATAGVAAFAVAAFPAAVFASSSTPVVDNIEVTVEEACTITSGSGPRDVTSTISAGAASETVAGTAFAFTCSDSNWTVGAAATGTADHKTELYNASATAGQFTSNTTMSGNDSHWAFQVAATGGNIVSGYNDWHTITDQSVTIVNGSARTGSVTPSYEFWAAADQDALVYTGQVTYTLAIAD